MMAATAYPRALPPEPLTTQESALKKKTTRKTGAQPTKSAKPTKQAKPPTLKQLEAQAKREEFELWLLRDIHALKLPEPQRQYLFHPTSNYAADFCWPRERLIVEVDGGVYIPRGHHNFGAGYEYDRVRDAEALCLGYTVLRVTPGMVKDGRALTYIERVLHAILAKGRM